MLESTEDEWEPLNVSEEEQGVRLREYVERQSIIWLLIIMIALASATVLIWVAHSYYLY